MCVFVDFIVRCEYDVIFCLSGCNHAMWGHAMITDVKLYICEAASSTQWGFFLNKYIVEQWVC